MLSRSMRLVPMQSADDYRLYFVFTLNSNKWNLLITKTNYSGGLKEESGIWYPYEYCLETTNQLFLFNFYDTNNPTKKSAIFDQILSTFKFTEKTDNRELLSPQNDTQ